uniref:GIY-YIG domain-containing protein n=1 Tax=Angiostrongylus cantonensis TaxID=6313 RepID=A0A0K0CVJ9_ANGCA
MLKKGGLEESVAKVEIPPDTLRRQLGRNRLNDRLSETENCVICPFGKDGDCMSSGAIYLISCGICGDEYIGETGKSLCIRIKEHLDGKRKAGQGTPLGTHRIQKHSGDDFDTKVAILARDTKTPTRKLLESFWINAKNPKMNSRKEYLEITHDLAPTFVSIVDVGRSSHQLYATLSGRSFSVEDRWKKRWFFEKLLTV